MPERLTQEQETALIEQAFAPGTLVHGLSEELWLGQNLRNGIKPTNFNGIIRLSVCTAMLPNVQDRWRSYVEGMHYGPKGDSDSEIGFLLSAQAIMEKHPGLLGAIGIHFSSNVTINGVEWNRFGEYGVDREQKKAYGIPIYHTLETHWDDEVRLLCHDESETVTPDMWRGIVIARKSLPYLIREAKAASYTHDTPVFSTHLDVITPSLADLARKQ